MNQEQKEEIIKQLTQKGVTLPCPRCGNKSFTLIDGYFNQAIQKDLNVFSIGGPSIPTVVTACTNCGYLTQHALGSLGLLPKEDKKPEEGGK